MYLWENSMGPVEHYNHVRNLWLEAFLEIRLYLHKLDGDTSRAVGRIVRDIVDSGPSHNDWPDTGAALFLRHDPDLWHELANSRKR